MKYPNLTFAYASVKAEALSESVKVWYIALQQLYRASIPEMNQFK